MTHDQVMELRAEAAFVSPLAPVAAGRPTLMFNSRGTYEWLMHPDDAFRALVFGYEVVGKMLPCHCVDVAPMLGALMIRAQDPDRPTGFVDASKTSPV